MSTSYHRQQQIILNLPSNYAWNRLISHYFSSIHYGSVSCLENFRRLLIASTFTLHFILNIERTVQSKNQCCQSLQSHLEAFLVPISLQRQIYGFPTKRISKWREATSIKETVCTQETKGTKEIRTIADSYCFAYSTGTLGAVWDALREDLQGCTVVTFVLPQ